MPFLKRNIKSILHAGFWIIFLLLSMFFFANFWPWHIAILRSLANGVLFIVVFYVNLQVLIPYLFVKKKYLFYALASLTMMAIFFEIRVILRDFVFGIPSNIVVTSRPYQSEFLILTSFLFVFALSIVYKLADDHLIVTARNREILRQRDESELRMLKSQVNPHFLFNTLNNLYSLAYTRSEKTPAAIMSLSEIMRYLIYEVGASQVPAENEVRFLTNYVELEKLRIEDPSKVTLMIEKPLPGLMVSPLIFINFVENAFKHSGIDTDPEGFIQIFLAFRPGEILFTCENRIPLIETTQKTAGVGLANARARLSLIYPGKTNLAINKSNLVYSVSLTINL